MSTEPLPENITGGWTGGKIRCALFVTPQEKNTLKRTKHFFRRVNVFGDGGQAAGMSLPHSQGFWEPTLAFPKGHCMKIYLIALK